MFVSKFSDFQLIFSSSLQTYRLQTYTHYKLYESKKKIILRFYKIPNSLKFFLIVAQLEFVFIFSIAVICLLVDADTDNNNQ